MAPALRSGARAISPKLSTDSGRSISRLHAKIAVVDDERMFIGSMKNWLLLPFVGEDLL
jgi:hypothetical protein